MNFYILRAMDHILKLAINCTFIGADIALVLDSLNLLGKQIIFLPINDLNKTTEAGGSHW